MNAKRILNLLGMLVLCVTLFVAPAPTALVNAANVNPCDFAITKTVTLGVPDAFGQTNYDELTHPTANIIAAILATNPNIQFTHRYDEPGFNLWFVDSFTWPLTSANMVICSARLETWVRSNEIGSSNDAIHLWVGSAPSAPIWWRYINAVRDANGLISLNLAALPRIDGTTLNILPELKQGFLHVSIQDDTSVDYITLTMRIAW
jgi:hypothetical protein